MQRYVVKRQKELTPATNQTPTKWQIIFFSSPKKIAYLDKSSCRHFYAAAVIHFEVSHMSLRVFMLVVFVSFIFFFHVGDYAIFKA